MLNLCTKFGLEDREILSLATEILATEIDDAAEVMAGFDDEGSSLYAAVLKVEDLKGKIANIEEPNLRALIMSEIKDMKIVMAFIAFHIALMPRLRDIAPT